MQDVRVIVVSVCATVKLENTFQVQKKKNKFFYCKGCLNVFIYLARIFSWGANDKQFIYIIMYITMRYCCWLTTTKI